MGSDPFKNELRASIRRDYRKKRLSLSNADQHTAMRLLAEQGAATVRRFSRFTSYVPSDGEINPGSLLRNPGHYQVFLPAVDDSDQMRFALFDQDIPMITGRWGIPHPPLNSAEVLKDLKTLDAMLIPLVAFDRKGSRLGRGGGFYDKILARAPDSVLRIGIAHHFQEHQNLPQEAWDQKLDLVVTDREIIECRR